MIYQYSIVRYVPDPTRGEQLNVGVVVAAEDDSYFGARFASSRDASRLRRLGFGEDFGFLWDLASEMEEQKRGAQLAFEMKGGVTWGIGPISAATREWANSIQFSELRGAVDDDPDALLERLFSQYVSVRRERRERARDRRWVKRKVTLGLRQGLEALNQDPGKVLHRDERITGAHDHHTFDYALVNGKVRHLIETLSFEAGDRHLRKTRADALAWAIDDLRQVDSQLPISVATIGSGKLLDDAERVYESLGAELVREGDLEPWLERVPHQFATATS